MGRVDRMQVPFTRFFTLGAISIAFFVCVLNFSNEQVESVLEEDVLQATSTTTDPRDDLTPDMKALVAAATAPKLGAAVGAAKIGAAKKVPGTKLAKHSKHI